MKYITSLLITILVSTFSFSQETTPPSTSVDAQFRALYKNSNNYQEYKVIKKKDYGTLHTNVLDSIRHFKSEIQQKNNLLNSQLATIDNLEKETSTLNNQLTIANSKVDSISFLGIKLSKSTYTVLLFTIIFILLAALGLFIYKFKNSNIITTEAKSSLEEVENELNLFRKKSLEREQILRRKLQDEIIKNRGN